MGLAAAAGSLDTWSYFGLAHVFIANMTGNTVVLGYSLVTGNLARAAASGGAIACYVLGVSLGAILAKPVRRAASAASAEERQKNISSIATGLPPRAVFWPKRVTVILAIEFFLVLLAAAVGAFAGAHGIPRSGRLAHVLVGLGAIAIGMQSATMNAMDEPGITTTYISGTWTTMTIGWVQLFDGEEPREKKRGWLRRVLMQVAVLATYCGAAACTGFALHHHFPGGWLPAVLLGLVVLGASWRVKPEQAPTL